MDFGKKLFISVKSYFLNPEFLTFVIIKGYEHWQPLKKYGRREMS